MRILIAEDDLTSRTALAGLLNKNGYEVLVTVNGVEALDVLMQPNAPMLAILDWVMPEMDGLEVVRRIRALRPDRPSHIIMLSARRAKADIISALEIGANDYLSKPFYPDELLIRIKVARRMIELEDERQKSETNFRLLAENIDDVFWLSTPSIDRIIYVSPAFQKIWGLACESLYRQPKLFMESIHPEDQPRVIAALREHLQGNWNIEYRIIRPDGAMRWILDRGFPVRDKGGGIIFMCGVDKDITEHKYLEAKKASLEVQNRQLQKTQSLDRMAGAISHHFNNKLNVVMGYLEMVIGDLPPGDSHAENLERAMQSAQKAAEVSGNLLAYLGQIRNKVECLDLSEICTVLLPVLLAGMPKNVALETDLPAPGPYIRADAKQIQQILTNLVINAWEAIGEETGTVRLSVKTVPAADIPASHRFPLEWQPKEQCYACMEVTDSGCGIQGQDIEKIFDPFFSTKFTGRGLGLSIVLGIAKTHGAAITVENRLNGGSVFRVFFPLSVQIEARQNKQIAKAPEIAAGGTILLVEDEAALREMTRIALVRFGFTVFQAKDGIEAVEIFGQHKDEISCLFSDLTMPRMGGWQTISALRAMRRDLPVVLASGYDEDSVMKGEHPELPDFFLNKPYDLNKLGDTIGKAIARRAGVSEEGK
jgi:PAS domain S-box-containing protein